MYLQLLDDKNRIVLTKTLGQKLFEDEVIIYFRYERF
jgi:hypothetical protein